MPNEQGPGFAGLLIVCERSGDQLLVSVPTHKSRRVSSRSKACRCVYVDLGRLYGEEVLLRRIVQPRIR